ncbi:hypothetical protein J1605_017133 [Eschrichtius robustus]|uniref:Uncharacterized protein n=1 Tax=Eschrichtius robustus TaxID=9764 RepID=A0AB34I3B0_ESCRO|nr:hypothetical protein J1605_017133 [Eschrichtius robustus]
MVFLFSLILKLPSDSFKYLTWHNVEQNDIQGSQLRCPRVREGKGTEVCGLCISPCDFCSGPSAEELFFRQECTLPPRKRVLEKNKWETWLQENWEDCTNLNLSFQDLGDPYQVANFNRILRRLIRVETLWLVDNSLVDLSAARLPSYFYFFFNFCFRVFSCLPNLKMLDGILKLPQDTSPPETNIFSKICIVS